MGTILHVDGADVAWNRYLDAEDGMPAIRVKPLLARGCDAPPVQYVEYAAGQTDPLHRHDEDELFLMTEGELWLEGARTGPGGVIYVPAGTDYALRAGEGGASYFRVVMPSRPA